MSKLAKKLARAKHTEEYVRARQERMLRLRTQDPSSEAEPALAVGDPDPQAAEDELPQVARSAGIISICVALSRITGFIRTWSMAFALGATFLSSSYQVANNLPNQLYELVMGGMLVTAFLPVYISIKKKAGKEADRPMLPTSSPSSSSSWGCARPFAWRSLRLSSTPSPS